MLKYHKHIERWGEFVDVKVNAPQVLSNQLPKIKMGTVWISSVTDPYQAVEEKYDLTRKILQKLLQYQFHITVLTKSKLVLRDINIFRHFKECEIGMTIITLDETVRERFEPNASKIFERLDTLRILHEVGVKTYVFIGPFLPYISEETINELANQIKEVGVDRVLIDRLNIKAGNWQTIQETLSMYYPELLLKFKDALNSQSTYYSKVKKDVSEIFDKKELEYSFCY